MSDFLLLAAPALALYVAMGVGVWARILDPAILWALPLVIAVDAGLVWLAFQSIHVALTLGVGLAALAAVLLTRTDGARRAERDTER